MSAPASVPPKPLKRDSWLLKISLAPWNYPLSFVADATLALALLTFAAFTIDRPRAVAPVVVAALITYTLIEYVSHRFAFHGSAAPRVLREGHAKHHAAPEARLAMPFFAPLGPAIVVTGLASAVVGLSLGALFTGVAAVGYFAYDTLHHLVHTPAVRFPPVPWLRAVHNVHHERPRRNYGVTTPLWDFVLRTWTAPKKG
jgi:sterol desaturase/sphingolipid hydroxylase (fatty acid hydroxylase superfamily)